MPYENLLLLFCNFHIYLYVYTFFFFLLSFLLIFSSSCYIYLLSCYCCNKNTNWTNLKHIEERERNIYKIRLHLILGYFFFLLLIYFSFLLVLLTTTNQTNKRTRSVITYIKNIYLLFVFL